MTKRKGSLAFSRTLASMRPGQEAPDDRDTSGATDALKEWLQ